MLHMKAHKSWLVQLMEMRGVKEVFPEAPDTWTVEDGIKQLDNCAPREYWPECSCEKPDGSCAGHT